MISLKAQDHDVTKKLGQPETLEEIHQRLVTEINNLRDGADLDLRAFAKATGFSQQGFNRWQNGSSPTVRSLYRIAQGVRGVLYVGFRSPVKGVKDYTPGEETDVHSVEAIEAANLIDSLGDDPASRDRVLKMVRETCESFRRAAANPHEPAEEQAGSRHGRRK